MYDIHYSRLTTVLNTTNQKTEEMIGPEVEGKVEEGVRDDIFIL